MDDQACPRCKTTKYRNPSLKLLVNTCGHALCDTCVELLFVKGSGSCPVCAIPLRRGNFRTQLFEDAVVEKEVDIRKKILRDYNKKEEDFNSLWDYNNYLEEVETIIYNLTHNIQVESTKQAIEKYKKENKVAIQKNKSKLSKDEQYIEDLIENEQMESAERRRLILQQEKEETNLKSKQKENLIDELMFSDAPAGNILAAHSAVKKQNVEKPLKNSSFFTTNMKLGQRDSFLPLPKDEGLVYKYNPVNLDLGGPVLVDYSNLEKDGYLKHIRSAGDSEKAGGYVSNLACFRALQEAMSGLYCEN